MHRKILRSVLVLLLPSLLISQLAQVVSAQSKSDYDSLAAIVSEPVFTRDGVQKAIDSYRDSGVMTRKELQRQRLSGLKQLDSSIDPTRRKIAAIYTSCYNSLREIRRLDSNTPDYEGLVMKSLKATPALLKSQDSRNAYDNRSLDDLAGKVIWEVGKAIVNSYNLSVEQDNYKKHYRDSRFTANDLLGKLVSKRYAGVPKKTSGTVSIASINYSLANTYVNDCIGIRNDSGKNLTGCSLFLMMKGSNADTKATEYDRHFHYVNYWPPGTTYYFWYPSKSFSGIGGNASVDVLQQLDVYFYSNEEWRTVNHKISQESYDKALKDWALKNLPGKDFTGRWRKASDNIVDPAGFEVTYRGELHSFTVEKVTIEAVNGTQSKRVFNGDNKWNRNQMKWICHDNFNSIAPAKVNVHISFPGSTYQRTISWTL